MVILYWCLSLNKMCLMICFIAAEGSRKSMGGTETMSYLFSSWISCLALHTSERILSPPLQKLACWSALDTRYSLVGSLGTWVAVSRICLSCFSLLFTMVASASFQPTSQQAAAAEYLSFLQSWGLAFGNPTRVGLVLTLSQELCPGTQDHVEQTWLLVVPWKHSQSVGQLQGELYIQCIRHIQGQKPLHGRVSQALT